MLKQVCYCVTQSSCERSEGIVGVIERHSKGKKWFEGDAVVDIDLSGECGLSIICEETRV